MINVIVAAKRKETEDISSFILRREEGLPLPLYEPGAHVDVHLPNGLVRQYSLCGPAGENAYYQISVLNDPSSRGGSKIMHEQIDESTRLTISEPRNLFPLGMGSKKDMLFAGGIGVTPILAMAEFLDKKNKAFAMHYCTRSESRMAFKDRISKASFADKVHFHFDDGEQMQKLDAKTVLAQVEPNVHLYVCGPTGFMDYILGTAQSLGWPDEQVHKEFFSAPEVDDSEALENFEIEINSTGQVLSVASDQRIIDVLEDNDIYIPVACEEGVCGTCLTTILSGEPDHRDVFMTDAEHKLNKQFTPCCSRSKSKKLVLDL